MKYATRQGRLLLDYFGKYPEKHITAEELSEALKNDVAKATIYRQLEKLVGEGSIRKYSLGKGNSSCYQLNREKHCELHYHLMCTECKKVIHLECEALDALSKHIASEHGFVLDSSRTVLYGQCASCRAKSKKISENK